MSKDNFLTARAFIWQARFDAPSQGFHVTAHDPGLGTSGGVIEATWNNAVRVGLAYGPLSTATDEQLSDVLKVKFWGTICDNAPPGLDLLLFNGQVMTGAYPRIVQQCLGLIDAEVDGWIGPKTIAILKAADPVTLIAAITGTHWHYLSTLPTYATFGRGWTIRLQAARVAALELAMAPPKPAPVTA